VLRGMIARRPTDSLALSAAAIAVVAVIVNALYMQKGPHPAPMFSIQARPVVAFDATGTIVTPRPRPLGRDVMAPAAELRTRTEIVADIQRELHSRGLYDGTIDGVFGPKTDAAIRDFEQTTGRRPSGEPSEALLQAIQQAPLRTAAVPQPKAPRNDPIAELIAPSRPRVMAVQRALSDFGYGQLKPSGTLDAATRAAIEKFERDRRLPVTGEVSDRLIRELAAATGRPLE
jgi:peptidoglycan hydrolase-like protein with peptidoglycan-binding domain